MASTTTQTLRGAVDRCLAVLEKAKPIMADHGDEEEDELDEEDASIWSGFQFATADLAKLMPS